jgi:peptide/nickel transport system substrate-binding protein
MATGAGLRRRELLAGTAAGMAAGTLARPGIVRADDRPDLVIGVDNLWSTMEPVVGVSATGSRVHPQLFDTLVERDFAADPDGVAHVPHLAAGWRRRSDTVWEVTIRAGVRFHDGSELTAEDVAWTISAERYFGPKPSVPRAGSYLGPLAGSRATGRHTVELETSFAEPNFMNRFVTPLGYVLPRAAYETAGQDRFGRAPVGTGPYRCVEFNPATHLRAEAFDDCWGGKPPARSVTWRVVPEASARIAGLVSGELDMIVGVPADLEDRLRRFAGVTVIRRSLENYPFAVFDTLATAEQPDNPLQDPELRKAMVQAIDRPGIARALWGDVTSVPAPFNFPEYGALWVDPDRTDTYGYDPAAARRRLAASRYRGETLTWNIVRGFYPNYEAAAEIMVEQWREVGIAVRLNIVENFDLAYKRPFSILNVGMSSELVGDPTRPLWSDWGPTSSRARAYHKTWVPPERFVELGRQWERETDQARRLELYRAMVAVWEDVMPGFLLWRTVQTFAHRDGIRWIPTANNRMYLYGRYLTFAA